MVQPALFVEPEPVPRLPEPAVGPKGPKIGQKPGAKFIVLSSLRFALSRVAANYVFMARLLYDACVSSATAPSRPTPTCFQLATDPHSAGPLLSYTWVLNMWFWSWPEIDDFRPAQLPCIKNPGVHRSALYQMTANVPTVAPMPAAHHPHEPN